MAFHPQNKTTEQDRSTQRIYTIRPEASDHAARHQLQNN